MSRFAIIASRFNSLIVKQLVEGAEQALLQHGLTRTLLSRPRSDLQRVYRIGEWIDF